ncbi:MAG: ABC transporter ATP-binding protein [Firmicutes bacterium]|nr:ABC transporter ATP-binding protein [Bacillota bacterium]
MAILQTKDLVKEYKSGESVVRAVNGITMDINEGEFVAIVGPSGSGKSTLLYLLGLLEQPTSGSVLCKGEDLNALSSSKQADFRRNQVGFVFQQYNLLPVLNAAENIKVPLIPYKTDFNLNERANELLELVGLSHRAGHLPSQLSGGEQQRVAIARALLSKPEIVLADEPTGNLDSKNGEQVLSLLEEMRNKLGLTLVLITHDEAVARRADRIVRLKDGVLV